jgi:hypothetical protein
MGSSGALIQKQMMTMRTGNDLAYLRYISPHGVIVTCFYGRHILPYLTRSSSLSESVLMVRIQY